MYSYLSRDDAKLLEQLVLDADKSQDGAVAVVDNVVVAGAWRLPNKTLSRSFRVRVEDGLRYAVVLNAQRLILTGGRNDSIEAKAHVAAMRWADLFGTNADGSGGSAAARAFVESVPAALAPRLVAARASLRRLNVGPDGNVQSGSLRLPMRVLAEIHSKTTVENAQRTAALLVGLDLGAAASFPLGSDGDESSLSYEHLLPSAVTLVVSSAYHMRRCRVYFARALPTHFVLGMPTVSESEFELLYPKEGYRWVSIDPDNLPMAKTLTQKGVMSISRIFPKWFARFTLSLLYTASNWQAHLRCSLLSLEVFGAVREVGALVNNVYRGDLRISELSPR